jgi:hypothetical protein
MNYHRYFKLTRQNQLIVAEIRGAWSKEAAEDYARELKQLVQKMDGQSWARIVYLDQWQLGTPDFEKEMAQLLSWCIRHQLRYTAYVFRPDKLKEHQLNKFIQTTDDTGHTKVFTNTAEAFDWLRQCGFVPDNNGSS